MFVFEQEKCSGCGACVVACMALHHTDVEATPPDRRLRREEGLADGAPYVRFSMLACRHCQDALCLAACPTGAMHREGPWVRLDEDACVGCGACARACPFDAIVMAGKRPVKCMGCTEQVCTAACPTAAWRSDKV